MFDPDDASRRDRIERELFVRAGLVADAAPSDIAQLIAITRTLELAPGQIVLREGARPTRVVAIIEGRVELSDGRRAGPGDALGALDALLRRPAAATATAVTAVRALEVPVSGYLEFLADHVELAMRVIELRALELHARLVSLDRPERSLGPPRRALVPPGVVGGLDRLLAMRRVPAFTGASLQAQVSLAVDATEHALPAGATVFRAGDPVSLVWVVARGSVLLTSDTQRLLCGPGDLLEHYAALAGGRRRFTAAAAGDVLLLGIDREALLDRMEEHVDLVLALLGWLAQARETLDLIR